MTKSLLTPARMGLSAAAVAAALALAGCGASGGTPSASSGESSNAHSGHAMPTGSPSADGSAGFNSADAMFAQMMIPHHEQAVSMSETVLAKPGLDSRVANLAQRIKAAQAPEIATLKGWLSAWGRPTSMAAVLPSAGPGASPSAHSMEGMMGDGDMAQLASADGPTASKLFLSQMIAHHEGAVRMAQAEKGSGTYPDAVAMAESIITSQAQEITEMKGLLAGM